MDQGSSSAAHESPPNNNENNENDDWEKIEHFSTDNILLNYREMMSKMSKEELEKFVMDRTVRDYNVSRSSFCLPPHLSPSGPPLDPLLHTCTSCASNGGPSYYHQPLQQQQHPTIPTSGPYTYSTGGLSYPYPLLSSTYSFTPPPPPPPIGYSTQQPSIQSLMNPLYLWGGHLAQLLQRQSAMVNLTPLNHTSTPTPTHTHAPATETQTTDGMTDDAARVTSTSPEEAANTELVNSFMRNLLGQYTESVSMSQSMGWMHPQPGTLAGIPSVPPTLATTFASSTATSIPLLPPSTPPTSQHVPIPFAGLTHLTQCPDISFFMQYLKKQFESHEYAVFRDLERKVITAYGGKYLRQSFPSSLPSAFPSSLPSSFNSATEYAQPRGTIPCSNGINRRTNGVVSSPLCPSSASSFPSSPSSSHQPYNHFCPTPEQNRAISEAIIYAQARWPIGSNEGVCVPLTSLDMPPSVSYDQFTQLLPTFLSRFGEPLASFLTVLSCFSQDEMRTTSSTHGDNGVGREDVLKWEKILGLGIEEEGHGGNGGDLFHQSFHFTDELDEKMLRVLRDALRDIVDLNEDREKERSDEGRSLHTDPSPVATMTMDSDVSKVEVPDGMDNLIDSFSTVDEFFTKHINRILEEEFLSDDFVATPPPINSTCRIRRSSLPSIPTTAPTPSSAATAAAPENGLLTMSDEELREMLIRDAPRLELSQEMHMVLRAMERSGVRPPDYSSPQDLINKLIIYQYHYGVEAIPTHQPPILAINPHNGLPMTMEEVHRQLMTPPELMLLFPNSSKYRYHCSNAMITDLRKKKKIEVLELSDDEESDVAGGLHSLPVSIKREYVLGWGKFGVVYEGCVVPLEKTHPKEVDLDAEDKKVAIKAINMSTFTTYPYLKKQLDYEVSTLRQCMGFPSIVQFEGFTESPFNTVSPSQHAFIVMELMGCNLEDYVKKQESTRLSELHAKVIIRQIQTALHYLHCRGISHCDLKPSNVLLHEKSTTLPHVKLSDFGHVRYYGDLITETEIAKQTGGLGVPNNRGYRAPEHSLAQGFSPELDMYALGAVSYFIMTGFVPNLTAPRNPPSHHTHVMHRTRKGKKGKKVEESIEPRMSCPSVASMVSGCVLPITDERMLPEENFMDLVDEPHLWPYTSKLGYHFCKEHMLMDAYSRISLRDSMDHEWLSGFEMYSMLRRLECKMGLFKPSERHLTTVRDDVYYHRSMLYMASNPSFIPPISSLSGGGDLSNGSTALLNLYAREGDYSFLYAPQRCVPPETTPLSLDSPLTGRSPLVPPPSLPPSVSPLPPLPIPLNEPVYGKKTNGKIKKKSK